VLREAARVLRDAGRLVATHWPALTLLAVVAYVSRTLLLDLAVVTTRTSAVLSNLVQAVIPFVQLLCVVAMFLVLRSRNAPDAGSPLETAAAPAGGRLAAVRRRARAASTLVIAAAAVLIPFLLIYEHDGALVDDSYALGYAVAGDVSWSGGDIYDRLAQATSVAVLGTVLGALAVRRVLTMLVRRTPAARAGRRAWLQLGAGYCEAVWIVLGAVVVRESLGTASVWWRTRVAGVALEEWWSGVALRTPHLAAWVESALAGGELLLAAAITAIVVPLAWLNLAAVVYGVEATKVMHTRDLAAGRIGAVVARVGDHRTQRALTLLTNPERRFGAVIGAAGLIARAGWRPVLVVCAAFLLTDNVDLLLWEGMRAVIGPQTYLGWDALDDFVDGAGVIAARVLTLALVASAANAVLVRLGLPDTLRLRRR
ncbi:hypothetical protein, partial [Actinotalea sp. JY-7885]|uniref:hypothetical protein n=1 Tax=Actinotalea sp. JY-7885 TaxID=2758576 RepID=UPI00165DD298